MNRIAPLLTLLSLVALALAGCSTANEENPITPEKMAQIRTQEAQGRGNFHPDMTPSPGGKK